MAGAGFSGRWLFENAMKTKPQGTMTPFRSVELKTSGRSLLVRKRASAGILEMHRRREHGSLMAKPATSSTRTHRPPHHHTPIRTLIAAAVVGLVFVVGISEPARAQQEHSLVFSYPEVEKWIEVNFRMPAAGWELKKSVGSLSYFTLKNRRTERVSAEVMASRPWRPHSPLGPPPDPRRSHGDEVWSMAEFQAQFKTYHSRPEDWQSRTFVGSIGGYETYRFQTLKDKPYVLDERGHRLKSPEFGSTDYAVIRFSDQEDPFQIEVYVHIEARFPSADPARYAEERGEAVRMRDEALAMVEGLRFTIHDTSPTQPQPAAAREPFLAVINLPTGLKPGDVLSPSYTISAADGSPLSEPVWPTLYINGKVAHSVIWDGSRTTVELKVTYQGQPKVVSAVLPAYGEALPVGIPGLGGIGILPGPESLIQGLAAIVVPGLLAAILGILGQPAPGTQGGRGGAHVLSDGRTYHDGQRYVFRDGVEYIMENGELRPLRSLADGDTFIGPDGSELIWNGGQPWFADDWRLKEATDQTFAGDHRKSVDRHWEKRQNEIHEEQASLHAKDEAELAKDKEYEIERDKVKQLLKATIDLQQKIDELSRDITDRSAGVAEGFAKSFEALKWVADTAIDVGAIAVPGGKYVKAGYKVATGAIEQGYKNAEIDVYKGIRGAVGGAIEAGKDFIPKEYSSAKKAGAKFFINLSAESVKSGNPIKGAIKGGVELVTQGTLEHIGLKPESYKGDGKTFIGTINDSMSVWQGRIMAIFGDAKAQEKAAMIMMEADMLDHLNLADLFFTEPVNPLSCRALENLTKTLGNKVLTPSTKSG